MLRYSLALVSSAYFQLLLALGSSGNISDITPQLSSLENGLQEVFDQMSEVRKEMEKQQLLHTQLEVHVAELVQEFHSWESRQQLTKHHDSLCSCSELQTRLVGVENVISDLQTMLKPHKTVTSPNPTLPSLAQCRKEEIPNGRIEYHKSDPHWIRRRTYYYPMSDVVENGTVIEIACNSRFKKEGPREASCFNGTWLNLAKCIPNPCQVRHQPRTEYQYMNDSYVDIGTVVHGNQVKITCDINHHIEINNQEKKSGSLECDRGRWHFTNAFQQHEYQDLPQCNPDPCDQVYKGEGMTVSYTKKNGWSFYPEYGENVQHGISVILGCKEGYSGTPRHDFQSNCHQGSWNPDPDDFHCSPANCRKEEIPNGRIEYHKSDPHWIRRRTYYYRMSDIVENGTVIEIACNSRFKKEGPREASCFNGTWLNLAKCIPNPCQVRHQPRTEYQYMNDSYVDIGTVVHGTQVKITCDLNHHIEINNQEKKSGSLECDRGRWHFTNPFSQREYQDLPQCNPDPCDQVHKGEGMTVRYTKQNGWSLYPEYGEKVRHGSSVILGCNEGYSGTSRHDFQSNCHQGSWNPDPDDFHCSPGIACCM